MEYKGLPALPYDVYCLVLDVLAADDSDPSARYNTLRACALTSSAWVSRAQFHLYRRIGLYTRRTLFCFARTITESPQHFAPLVEHIDVKISPAHGCGWPNDHRQIAIPIPSQVIAQMTKVQSARFTSSFQFAEAPASFVAFVRAFTACGTLRKVAIHYFFIPQFRDLIAILWSFPRMESLGLVECGWCTPRNGLELPDVSAYPDRCHSLDKLLVSKCSATTPILDIVKTSIQDITLCTRDADQCLTISAFTSLTRITIIFSTLQWAVTLLAYVRSEHVRELRLKLSANCLGNHAEDAEESPEEDAAVLDNLLSRAPFTGLRRLTVVPFWQDARHGRLPDRGWWVDTVQARLPQCHARGILRVPAWRH